MILKAFTALVLILPLSCVILSQDFIVSAKTGVIDVPIDFPTIQAAINNAVNGDTIFVHRNTYNERIIVNKTVSLIGEDCENTTIDASGSGTAITITAENTSVRNFTIKGSGSNNSESGILIDASFSNITENIITENNLFGICINYSSHAFISANIIERNKADGIVLFSSHMNSLLNNTIKDNSFGLHLYSSDQNSILNNTFTGNNPGAINLFYSSSNQLVNNNIVGNNEQGIVLDFSSNYNALTDNMIAATKGKGLTIGSSSNNTLRNNIMSSNTYNFYCPASRPNLPDFLNDIDTSNTVNGQPIYYIVSQRELLIEPPAFKNIGYLALINCTDIIVQNLTLSENGQGILLAFTNNTIIKQVKAFKNDYGIQLLSSMNNSITNSVLIDNNNDGITVDYSSIKNTISATTVANSSNAIRIIHHSNENRIDSNVMTNNTKGLWIYSYNVQNTIIGNILNNNNESISMARECASNIITQNTITNSNQGVYLSLCSENMIFNNNFINNTVHATSLSSTNVWDSGYLRGGNFWSDYNGLDLYQGPNQDILGSDGIGDTAYSIDESNIDNYPLAGTFHNLKVTLDQEEYDVQVVSNSTVQGLELLWWLSSPNLYLKPGQEYIHFSVTGPDGTTGFCRVTIPRIVLNGTYIVLVDWQETPANELAMSNNMIAYIYFSYEHSSHDVIIIPELPSAALMLTLIIVTTMILVRRNQRRKLLRGDMNLHRKTQEGLQDSKLTQNLEG